MKVFESVGKKIRCQASIDNMQFGFTPGKRTSDAIFHQTTSTRETPRKEEEAVLCFFGSRKGFDRVPREMVIWALRKVGVDEWLIRSYGINFVQRSNGIETVCHQNNPSK